MFQVDKTLPDNTVVKSWLVGKAGCTQTYVHAEWMDIRVWPFLFCQMRDWSIMKIFKMGICKYGLTLRDSCILFGNV